MMKTRIGIVGYGNIGRGVERAISQTPDMELSAVFTRREPDSISIETQSARVLHIDKAPEMKDEIDVLILCGGSATDLPMQGPKFAAVFNTVDSFDTHAKIPEYFAAVNKAAVNKTSIISVGWDPGLFSIIRMLTGAILPHGKDYTFWGKGVSQGHSDAIRRVEGVAKATQYTIPVEEVVERIRNGETPELTTGDKHIRECFVVAKEGADLKKIENDIATMPNYFADYKTIVHFISEDEYNKNHTSMPHGGFVFRNGETKSASHTVEFGIKLESNPEFTASILVAYARAATRMGKEGIFGAKTVFDVPLSYLSPDDYLALIKNLL